MQAALNKNIAVTNTTDCYDHDVADLGTGLILAIVRKIITADHFVKSDRSREEQMPFARSLCDLNLCDLRLGIVGLGKIGSEVAKRAKVFVMKVSYSGRQKQPKSVIFLYP